MIFGALRQTFRNVVFGIHIGDFVNRDAPAEIRLTPVERWEILRAYVKSRLTGNNIAHYLSSETELLLCGYRPARYLSRPHPRS